jgi:hypothetical protein
MSAAIDESGCDMRIRLGCFVSIVTIALAAATPALAGDPNKSIFSDDDPAKGAPAARPAPSKPHETSPAETRPEAPARTGPDSSSGDANGATAPLPVPPAPALREAGERITDRYRDDFATATTKPQKAALAHKLLAAADQTRDDPTDRYVLLTRAMDMALAGADTPAGCDAVGLLASQYRLDPKLPLAVFTSLSKVAASPRDCGLVVLGLARWTAELVRQDQYDLAKRAADVATAAARRSNDPTLITETQDMSGELAEIEAAYPAAKHALAALAANPSDPAANAVAGRFLCFLKGDWQRGLPLLKATTDPALREPANAELHCPPTAAARAAVADRWWDAAERETGLAQQMIRRHAVAYYRAALPGLTGLAKTKAQKRIGPEPQPPSAHGPRS